MEHENSNGSVHPSNGEEKKNPNPLDNVRRDFYQTESDVVVSIYLKKKEGEVISVSFTKTSFTVTIEAAGERSVVGKEFQLVKQIDPDSSTFKVLSTKVEIRLRKEEAGHWGELEAKTEQVKADANAMPAYPTSSRKRVDWDKIEKEVIEDERKNPSGDAFSMLYDMTDEDGKRAMVKSIQESKGTVLNMNWNEVGKKKVEMSPPDGMEFKKWDA